MPMYHHEPVNESDLPVMGAVTFIVERMREMTPDHRVHDCDVYVPHITEAFVEGFLASNPDPNSVTDPSSEDGRRIRLTRQFMPVFLDAAWHLCRVGVLRPGPLIHSPTAASVGMNGYSLTVEGKRVLPSFDFGTVFNSLTL